MKDLPYSVMTRGDIDQGDRGAWSWCQDQWGPRWAVTKNHHGSWCCFYRTKAGQYEWHFETEQQALLFSLRWAR
jgi:hypothetical protein